MGIPPQTAPGQKLPNGLIAATREEIRAAKMKVGADAVRVEGELNQQGKTSYYIDTTAGAPAR
jgi:hypothetical protein